MSSMQTSAVSRVQVLVATPGPWQIIPDPNQVGCFRIARMGPAATLETQCCQVDGVVAPIYYSAYADAVAGLKNTDSHVLVNVQAMPQIERLAKARELLEALPAHQFNLGRSLIALHEKGVRPASRSDGASNLLALLAATAEFQAFGLPAWMGDGVDFDVPDAVARVFALEANESFELVANLADCHDDPTTEAEFEQSKAVQLARLDALIAVAEARAYLLVASACYAALCTAARVANPLREYPTHLEINQGLVNHYRAAGYVPEAAAQTIFALRPRRHCAMR